jgi:acetylornithine deacetylase/succinyl-diaminopimelate desuccinylase-like protein
MVMDISAIQSYVNRNWDESIVRELSEYILIPNKSPAFDPDWKAHGHMERAVARYEAWARRQPIAGMTVEVVRLQERTPLLLIDVPASPGVERGDDCVLLYGHLDKQPEMAGWRAGLDPWKPVLEGERLYGRGAADDGYAMFACLTAIGALEAARIPHARCVVTIEACEESGSYDLPPYVAHLAARIGTPSLVIALDSGCANYEQLWSTTSLRGLVGGTLTVEVLTEGVHSGAAGGVVPDSFRIARLLLDRIENPETGRITAAEFNAEIPAPRLKQARAAAASLGAVAGKFPFAGSTQPIGSDPMELILNRTWRPALAIIGADGLPPAGNAGNVLRPRTALKLSLRLPPTCNSQTAGRKLKELMEEDPPHGAQVRFEPNWGADGWDAPALAPWLEASLERASRAWFGKPAAYMGEGGTIPFMGMLGERFPQAQFLITGVLGPHSNAHGPNEFLHLPTARKLTGAVASVIAEHVARG